MADLSMIDLGGLLYALALLIAALVWLFQPREKRVSSQPGRVSRLMAGWSWSGRAPLSFAVLRTSLWAYMIAVVLIMSTIPGWARERADLGHSVPITMRNGHVYYVPKWFGQSVDLILPGAGALLLALAYSAWRNRGQLERYAIRRAG
jgi:hypothetical protein